jgi:hypothetical protein
VDCALSKIGNQFGGRDPTSFSLNAVNIEELAMHR